ncbi:MAG: hypothetical protein P4M11_03225 [Candidatus Pacebacteria bacterium]|nr:hypothetical protein [Candidatus Paceibacterota bacterium]
MGAGHPGIRELHVVHDPVLGRVLNLLVARLGLQLQTRTWLVDGMVLKIA